MEDYLTDGIREGNELSYDDANYNVQVEIINEVD